MSLQNSNVDDAKLFLVPRNIRLALSYRADTFWESYDSNYSSSSDG